MERANLVLWLELDHFRPLASDFADLLARALNLARYRVVVAGKEALGLEVDFADGVCLVVANHAFVAQFKDHLCLFSHRSVSAQGGLTLPNRIPRAYLPHEQSERCGVILREGIHVWHRDDVFAVVRSIQKRNTVRPFHDRRG